MFAFLFCLATVPGADVRLEDARLFANVKPEDAQAKVWLALHFQLYISERKMVGKVQGDAAKAVRIYGDVRSMNTPGQEDAFRLSMLRSLREELGEAAYAKGLLPPPYPKKYEKDFMRWRNEQATRPKSADD